MLTKTTKIVNQPVEVEVFNLELTKDQLIELAGLLGNCSSKPQGLRLFCKICDTLEGDQKTIVQVCAKFEEHFKNIPILEHL